MSTDRCKEDTPFLERSVEELGWIKSNFCLLIVGIAGSDFIEVLLKRFPKLRIIAMDKQPRLIEKARCFNIRDNITYCNADIEERETLKYWLGTARKILSYHNLERVTDVKKAFKNFHDLLVPGGTVAVRFTIQNPVFNWMKEIFLRWRQFIRDLDAKSLPQSKEVDSDVSYQNILKSIGFEILCFRNMDGYRSFKSDTQCRSIISQVLLSTTVLRPSRSNEERF
ncbi:unnamed protein product [Larinioides sclopetarius]